MMHTLCNEIKETGKEEEEEEEEEEGEEGEEGEGHVDTPSFSIKLKAMLRFSSC